MQTVESSLWQFYLYKWLHPLISVKSSRKARVKISDDYFSKYGPRAGAL